MFKMGTVFAAAAVAVVVSSYQAYGDGKVPTKFTKCSSPVSPANSGGHFFSEDCSTLWILPPAVAAVSLTGIAPSRSKSFCNSVDNLTAVFDKAALALKNAAENQSQGESSKPGPASECEKNQSNLIIARAIRESLNSDVTALDLDITQLNARIASCTTNCGFLALQLQTRQNARAGKQSKLSKVGIIIPVLEGLTTNCAAINASTPVSKPVSELGDEAKKVGDQLLDLLTKFGTVEGATASMLFEIKWQKLVEDYKTANPTLAVERMPVDMALSFVASRPETVSLPAVFSVSVPGLTSQLKTSDLTDIISNTASVQFGNSASGQIIFSALGACAMQIYSGAPPDPSAVYTHLVANVTFRYFVQTERKYKVKYNLDEIYKRVKKVSSSNGLFRSSYDSSVTNMSSSDEVITVTIESEDPRNAFPDTVAFITDIKRSVLDRALQQVTRSYLPRDAAGNLPAIGPGTLGAPKMADDLRKCPYWYCQVGALVLDLGSALFGGADAVSTYVEEHHIKNEEAVSDKRMVAEFSTFSFKPQ